MTINKIKQLAQQYGFTLTKLRQEILQVLLETKHPLGAYDILHHLKKNHPAAKPPTVYRVLQFFEECHVVHRLNHSNTYMLCQLPSSHPEASIVFSCHHCDSTDEFYSNKMGELLHKLCQQQHIQLTNSIIEISGTCQACQRSANI